MDQPPQSDIAQQEAAARDYKPDLQADPIYIAKTSALPQTYSHYRPIQGDGNCGWRAIAFAYFEVLVRSGDVNQLQDERLRLAKLNEGIAGGEDLVEETDVLFDDLAAAMVGGGDPNDILFARFNDDDIARYLVYHHRLLAAARLRAAPDEYRHFLTEDIESYVQGTVMPLDREIEDICVTMIAEILLKPARIGLGIVYLDRSAGTEANTIPMTDNWEETSVLGRNIYLLYRPGHYDILYREPQVAAAVVPAEPVSIQVNRAASFTQHHQFQDTMPSLQDYSSLDLGPLAMIPPVCFEPAGLSPLASPPAGASPITDMYAPSPQSPWVTQQFADGLPAPTPQQPSPEQPTAAPPSVHPQFRLSKYNFPNLPEMAGENSSSYEPAFTTNTFKNSHFNVAHYNNTNFQPEMYKPEADEEMMPANNYRRNAGRKRSSELGATIKKESR
ncbi:peptidase C65 Otubain-domain-containing protein [Xylariaceae sp. FL0804]|nr:peptidase C65 Otubain-domain-containing protein [Xylariaceae sp. FL0804]